MVVTHSCSSVLMSVRSQAPASAGGGRGASLATGTSGFEVDVEGPCSVWEWKRGNSDKDNSSLCKDICLCV